MGGSGGVAGSSSSGASSLPRSDSMDSMLGDSLLDPPQSLQKIPPKRYQSPSRCGSPSLEAPEHLLFGAKREGKGSRKLIVRTLNVYARLPPPPSRLTCQPNYLCCRLVALRPPRPPPPTRPQPLPRPPPASPSLRNGRRHRRRTRTSRRISSSRTSALVPAAQGQRDRGLCALQSVPTAAAAASSAAAATSASRQTETRVPS